jgi:xylose isomerase
MNFDAKLRRQSIARDDLFHAHIGGMDTLARALLAAASILDDGELDRRRNERYAGWAQAGDLLRGEVTLQELHDAQLASTNEPGAVSGRQEALENLVARHVERVR